MSAHGCGDSGGDDWKGAAFRRHAQGVFLFLLRRLSNRDDAEDCTQDVFGDLNKLVEPPPTINAWLVSVARNKAVDFIRKKKRRPPTISLGDKHIDQFPSSNPESCPSKPEYTKLYRALEQLPPEFRLVVVLYYINGTSLKDIAVMLSLPLGTVKSWSHRARNRLREILGDGADE